MATKLQLSLVGTRDDEGTWKLDDRTRELGRRGVAAARDALRAALARQAADPPAA